MEFIWNNESQRLQGIDKQARHCISIKRISKDIRNESVVFAVSFYSLEALPHSTHIDIQQLMHEFEYIFQDPRQLPSLREIDHHINLKEGPLVNVRLYHYAYFQKAEIKKKSQQNVKVRTNKAAQALFHPLFYWSRRKMEPGGFV